MRGIGSAVDIELGRGESLKQIGLGTRGILRDIENLGAPQSDGAIKADIAQAIGLDHAGEAQGAGGGKAGVNANLVIALFQLHGI